MLNVIQNTRETCEPRRIPMMQQQGKEDPSMNVTGKNFSPEYLQELYQKTSPSHRRTNLTDQFFRYENILYILDQIRLVLKELTGENVIVSFNDEMVHTMWQVASDNVGGLT